MEINKRVPADFPEAYFVYFNHYKSKLLFPQNLESYATLVILFFTKT